mmetsp:Transcript_15075/g.34871  ORF Transcript_15075/g.34871 Transcript_15075/m.34871 type:complete len:227 (-) Transcript_15075:772-1452(-)
MAAWSCLGGRSGPRDVGGTTGRACSRHLSQHRSWPSSRIRWPRLDGALGASSPPRAGRNSVERRAMLRGRPTSMLELDGGHDGGWNEEAATFGSVDRRVTSDRRGARRRLRLSCPSRSVKSGGPRIGGGHDDDDAVTLSSRREGQEDVVRTCGLQNPGDFAAAERKLRKRQRRELEKYNAKNGGDGRTVYRDKSGRRKEFNPAVDEAELAWTEREERQARSNKGAR